MRKKYRQQAKKWSWKSILWIILVSFGLVIAINTSRTEIVEFFFVSVMLLYLFNFWLRWRADYCLKKLFDVQKNQLNGQIMDIEESGISGQWENGNATYQYKWSAFESFLELPDGFLFFPNSVAFVRVPKESLSADEQQTIKSWAEKIISIKP